MFEAVDVQLDAGHDAALDRIERRKYGDIHERVIMA